MSRFFPVGLAAFFLLGLSIAAQADDLDKLKHRDCRMSVYYRPEIGQRPDPVLLEMFEKRGYRTDSVIYSGNDFFPRQEADALFASAVLLPAGKCIRSIPGQSTQGQPCCTLRIRMQKILKRPGYFAVKEILSYPIGSQVTGPVSCSRIVKMTTPALPKCVITSGR